MGVGVDDALVSAIFQVLLEKLASPGFRDFIKGDRENWDLLVLKLRCLSYSITPVLNEAEQKQLSNPTVMKWLDDLTTTLYEAGDELDDIGFEALRSKVESQSGSFISQVRGLVSSSLESLFKTKRDRIEHIIEKLNILVSKKENLGLGQSSQTVIPQGSPPAPLAEESFTFGRRKDKRAVLDFLLADNTGKRISVMSIDGIPGIGKTTLAQVVYSDDAVKNRFPVRAWVYASSEFKDLTLTRKVLEAVTRVKSDIDDPHELQIQLMQALEGKCVLLVLDNYSDENSLHWDALKSPFQKVARGSKIMLTTCNGRVSKVTSDKIHRLQTLSPADSLLLFEKHAFNNRNSPVHPDLKAIGEKIVDRCCGLPLAVKSLASFLSSEPNSKEWEVILKCDFFQLYKKEQNILHTLGSSYYCLPPQLKQCFAFCAIFPKGYEFEKEKLVFLWMANDLLQCEEGKQMEDLGDEYFQALIESSLFQQSRCNQPDRVTMHPLVHELATFVSGKFTMRLDGSVSHGNQREARHLSCIGQEGAKQLALPEDSCLRTLLLLGFTGEGSLQHNLALPKTRSLRAAFLAGSQMKKLPHSIQMLTHLRYLNVSSSSIEGLPEEICGLYYLQTILLTNCRRLTHLPTNMRSLINLRHLDTYGTCLVEMPPRMSNLKQLRILTNFVLATHTGVSIKELRELRYLQGRLAISGLQNVCSADDVLEASLKEKNGLCSLEFTWAGDDVGAEAGRGEFDKEILEKLQPHTNLNELHISFYDEWQSWSFLGAQGQVFSDVKKLYLINCPKLDVDVPRHFPSLTILQRTHLTLAPQLPLPRSPQTNTTLERTQFMRRCCFP